MQEMEMMAARPFSAVRLILHSQPLHEEANNQQARRRQKVDIVYRAGAQANFNSVSSDMYDYPTGTCNDIHFETMALD